MSKAVLPTPIEPPPERSRPGSVRLVRHRSDLGQWQIAIGAPDPRLAAHVVGYWGYTDAGMRVTRRRKSPTGNATMIINFGPAFRLTDTWRPDVTLEPRTGFIAGLHDTAILIESTGDSHCLQVDLTPIGAFRFLGQPMDALTHQIVDLEDILGAAAHHLREALYEAEDWSARFALLDATIARHIAGTSAAAPGVAWAWAELQRTAGRITVGALSHALGCSRQHLITRFHQQIGLPPKTLARIIRFNGALRRLEQAGDPDWAAIALDCGYYDQAHFNRDFRRFSDCTPGMFLRHRLPDHGGVAGL